MTLDSVTICITTFERPYCLESLLSSIRRHYKDIRISIADNGRKFPAREIAGRFGVHSFFELDFDCGVSAARNHLVKNADTEFVFICDDDMIFTRETDLSRLLFLIRRNKLDVLSLSCYSTERHLFCRLVGVLEKRENVLFRVSKHPINFRRPVLRTEITHNVFMARRASLLSNLWDERLKFSELLEFFWRAKGKLAIGTTNQAAIKHCPKTDPYYDEYRGRNRYFEILANEIMGVVDRNAERTFVRRGKTFVVKDH